MQAGQRHGQANNDLRSLQHHALGRVASNNHGLPARHRSHRLAGHRSHQRLAGRHHRLHGRHRSDQQFLIVHLTGSARHVIEEIDQVPRDTGITGEESEILVQASLH